MSRRGLPQTGQATPAEAVVTPTQPAAAPPTGPPSPAVPRQRAKLTVQLPAELVEELRDAVVFLPTQGVQATVAGLVTQALPDQLAWLRDQYHDGHRFPQRHTDPQAGRPIDR
jgi:hypothetical protein